MEALSSEAELGMPNLGAKMYGAEAERMEGFLAGAAVAATWAALVLTPLPFCNAKIWLSGMEVKTERTDGGAAETHDVASAPSGASFGMMGAAGLLSLQSQGSFHSQPIPRRSFFLKVRATASPGGSKSQPCSWYDVSG